MSDKERKGESSERDEDERKVPPDAEVEPESDEARKAQDEDEASDDDNGAAQRVAAALGVGEPEGEDEGAEAAPADEAAAAPNRAARRAEAAQRRKKRKGAGASTASTEEAADEPLPKDKNARAKELLKRRREQAAEPRPVQLLPGEMVDDALARSSSAVAKWIRENFSIIQWVIVAAIVGGGGYAFYQSRADKTSAGASSALMIGVDADRGRVMAEDKRSDEEKEADPQKVFKTADERADTALAGFRKVIAEHADTGAAILARLGEGGAFLDKHDWDHALEAFSAVSSSSLANADPDVKGRALEGLGFAKEGKGDLDGALATFKELESVDGRGFKELGLYHQGRIQLAKGDKDKAKDLLKQAHDKLEQPTTDAPPLRYLQQVTDDALRRIDPSLVPAKASTMGGPKGGSMTPDEIEKLRRKLMEQMEKKEQH